MAATKQIIDRKLATYVQTDTAIDANAATSTTALDLLGATKLGLYIVAVSGTTTTHVVTLQVSPDNVTWYNTSTTITGATALTSFVGLTEVVARFARATVTTVQGVAAVIDITLIAN